jgi:hypothetical protein
MFPLFLRRRAALPATGDLPAARHIIIRFSPMTDLPWPGAQTLIRRAAVAMLSPPHRGNPTVLWGVAKW